MKKLKKSHSKFSLSLLQHSFYQCFGSASFWCGSRFSGVRIRIRVRFRIRPKIEQSPIFFFLIFFCKRYKTNFFCNFELIIHVCILNKISNFFFFKLYSYNFGWFLCEFVRIFFATRIRINVFWLRSGSGQMIRI